MSRKKKHQEQKEQQGRPERRVMRRGDLVLRIVQTDNTFGPQKEQWSNERPLITSGHVPCWVGKCIHCNSKVFVTPDGFTDATIEHIVPLCDGGHPSDLHNLALACARCNNEKGIRHDKHAGKGGRADEVIGALMERRLARWRDSAIETEQDI